MTVSTQHTIAPESDLTAGKQYPIVTDYGDMFKVVADHGGYELVRTDGCHHIDGQGWNVND